MGHTDRLAGGSHPHEIDPEAAVWGPLPQTGGVLKALGRGSLMCQIGLLGALGVEESLWVRKFPKAYIVYA